jgi:hypothetical protein
VTRELVRGYERLNAQEEIQFLASLIFNLSMVARDTYIPGRYANANDRGRAFTEMIHRTASQLLERVGGRTGYPKETFFEMLSELSHGAGCDDDVAWAIQQSHPVENHDEPNSQP